MTTRITNVIVRDVRFPTSDSLDGSDAVNVDPDYSATYVGLQTDSPNRLQGYGLAFTNGRGNEVCIAFIEGRIFQEEQNVLLDPELQAANGQENALGLAVG